MLGYVNSDFTGDVNSQRVPLVMSSLWEWSCELGVEAAEDSSLVDDGDRVCHNNRSLQGADIAEEFFERARERARGSVTTQ